MNGRECVVQCLKALNHTNWSLKFDRLTATQHNTSPSKLTSNHEQVLNVWQVEVQIIIPIAGYRSVAPLLTEWFTNYCYRPWHSKRHKIKETTRRVIRTPFRAIIICCCTRDEAPRFENPSWSSLTPAFTRRWCGRAVRSFTWIWLIRFDSLCTKCTTIRADVRTLDYYTNWPIIVPRY